MPPEFDQPAGGAWLSVRRDTGVSVISQVPLFLAPDGTYPPFTDSLL